MPPTSNRSANEHSPFLYPGIIITVSILLAAGFAIYESPQVREWVDNSRRKIAIALHSLGDEINPRSRLPPSRHDSSMSEDASAEAEERRRRARQEIIQRGKILEEKKRRSSKSTSVASSFDSLVDKDGNLKKMDIDDETHAMTTGLDVAENEGLMHRSGMISSQQMHAPAPFETEFQAEYNRMMESTSQWDASSSHPSESLIDFRPTSEVPDPDISVPHQPLSQSDYFSLASSRSSSRSHTLDHEVEPVVQESVHVPDPPEFYYAHPSGSTMNNTALLNPFADHHDVSSASSIAGSMEHVAAEIESSDGISEIGDGIATPASWTDVGSDIGSHTGSQA